MVLLITLKALKAWQQWLDQSVFMCVSLWWCVFDSQHWPAVVRNQVLTASSSCSYQSLQTADALTMTTDPCLGDRHIKENDGQQMINLTSTRQLTACKLMQNRNMQCYLIEAGAAPRQWECWGVAAGSGTAGEIPWVGAPAVTHPGGETRPRGYWVVRTSPIFHTEILWRTHSHTQGWIHKFCCPLHRKKKNLPYCLVPFFWAEN